MVWLGQLKHHWSQITNMKLIIIACLLAVAVALPRKFQSNPKAYHVHPAFASKSWHPRIVGGDEATPHTIPHQVALYLGDYFCGGSLISEKWVLTAAHCGELTDEPIVILGAHKLEETEPEQVIVNGLKPIVHEEWDEENLLNDISLIELPEAVKVTDAIKPVALIEATAGNFAGETATASGWGLDSDDSWTISPVLRYTSNSILTNKECEDQFDLGLAIDKSIICMSGANGRSTCSGDSGGPLTVEQNGGKRQIGLTSFGISLGCELGYPAAFTRISSFRDWVKDKSGI